MPAPEPNDPKRDCSLPPGCKDLIDALREQSEPVPISLPPITRRVTFPEVVSVQYLSELLGHDIAAFSGYATPRSIPFDKAQRILRRYGIHAERTA
jgi:hypothetical protein